MSIFDVNFRVLFKQALPPVKVITQTIDLGHSLLASLQIDSAEVDALNDTLQIRKKYSGVKMVMEASLDEIFGETTFEVETETDIIGLIHFTNEGELFPKYLYNETEQKPFFLFNEAEVPADAAIIVSVPAALFSSSLDKVKSEAENLKVAGKSIKYISL